MPYHVLLTDAELAEDLAASLRKAGTPAQKQGRRVIVGDGGDPEPESQVELLFFLRTWALAHPGRLAFALVENGADKR